MQTKVFVDNPLGEAEPVVLELEPLATGQDVIDGMVAKSAIQESNKDSVELMHNGKPVERRATLKSMGVGDGGILKTVPKHRVGGGLASSFSSLPVRTRMYLLDDLRIVRQRGLPIVPREPLVWTARVPGRGRWSRQTFDVQFEFPINYRDSPPRVVFLTAPVPHHPNIHPGGGVCVTTLQTGWNSSMTIASVWEDLKFIMENPNGSYRRWTKELDRIEQGRFGLPSEASETTIGGLFRRLFS